MTHYLRFPDEPTALSALTDAGLMGEDGPILASHEHALDVIGTISLGGEWDADGNVITPPTVLDGWHINYVGELPQGWEQYVVTPDSPVRIFAP